MWDETKREKVLRERGIDIGAIPYRFFATAYVEETETALRAINVRAGHLISVIFALWGNEALVIKTAYLTTPQQRRRYDDFRKSYLTSQARK